MIQKLSLSVVTDGSGNFTGYIGSRLRGRIHAIKYEIGTITSSPLTVSGETTGVAILTKTITGDSWFYPVAPGAKVADGAASTLTELPVFVHLERIKVVVASGTASKVGTITVFVDEEG